MSRIIYVPKDIMNKHDISPIEKEYQEYLYGGWFAEEEIPDKWEKVLEDIDELKSDKAKDLINKTINGNLQWKFGWAWFTGGSWFAVFIHSNKNEEELRMQIAWPRKEWGFIVVVTGKDGFLYDSILDDEDYPFVGMELWHLAEDYCINPDELKEEAQKAAEDKEKGETYPPDPRVEKNEA